MSVKVILREDLKGVGKRGDIVEVSDGYARNFLLPKGHAFTATDGAVTQAGAMRRARDLRDAADRESATTIATALVPKIITIPAKSGQDGKLYGSVTAADVAAALEAKGVSVDKRRIDLAGGIKKLGDHTVRVDLHPEVVAEVVVSVIPER